MNLPVVWIWDSNPSCSDQKQLSSPSTSLKTMFPPELAVRGSLFRGMQTRLTLRFGDWNDRGVREKP